MEALKRLRQNKKLSQGLLARKIGVSPNTIWNFEKGLREPRMSDLIALSKVLECEIVELTNPETEKVEMAKMTKMVEENGRAADRP